MARPKQRRRPITPALAKAMQEAVAAVTTALMMVMMEARMGLTPAERDAGLLRLVQSDWP